MEPPSIPTPAPREAQPQRRTFLEWATYAVGAVAALALGIPFIAYLVGTPRRKSEWMPLGPLEAFPLGETLMVAFDNPLRQPWDGETAHTGVYVRYEGKDKEGKEQFLVLAVNCAHLGCPVSWFKESGLFMCPCHGGVYYANGDRASGPPPRGLFHCEWQVNDGHLEIKPPFYPSLQAPLDPKNVARRAPDAGCDQLARRAPRSAFRSGEDRA